MLRDCGTPQLDAALQQAFLGRGSEAWETALAALGVPASAVRSPAAFIDGPYRQTAGFSATLPSGAEVLGAGFRINGEAPRPSRDAPRLGADTDALLAELGFDAATLRARGIVA
jgi:crotonobetainyl-CoA:carnitine CoA-transferase CaiB-like acyl-CoA transferase